MPEVERPDHPQSDVEWLEEWTERVRDSFGESPAIMGVLASDYIIKSIAVEARERLGRVLLPIGEVASKVRVREIAAELDLNVADKPDSQEICFVEGDYVAWLREHRPETMKPGAIIDSAGNVLGEHAGVAGFTIGQRRGLGVAAGEPLYVTAIDPASATVTIGPRAEALSQRLTAAEANWHIDQPAPGEEFEAIIQIRYNPSGAPGRVRALAEGRFEVEFVEPVLAVTPGQAAVVYQGDRLLGGGWIE